MKVYVVTDESARVLGHVGEALVDRGAELVPLERTDLPAFGSLDEPALVLLMGSHLTAHDPSNATVAPESALALDALDAGVPVVGICYGSQLLARALGGDSRRGDAPELGWHGVETVDPTLCPPGPWAQAHTDVFVAPPTSTLLATSATGHQAFLDTSRPGAALAWQFHPEVTSEEFVRWMDDELDDYLAAGVDPDALRAETAERAAANREAAHALVDAALSALGFGPR